MPSVKLAESLAKESKKDKHKLYMRSYRAKHSVLINEKRTIRNAERVLKDPTFREQANKRNAKYYKKNSEKILEYHKNRVKDPVAQKVIRERHRDKIQGRIEVGHAKRRASKQGLKFDLDDVWYREQFVKGCAVTGLDLNRYGSKDAFTAHIDRIKPELGYTKENSRLVCACYNLAKKNWSDQDVLTMSLALVIKELD